MVTALFGCVHLNRFGDKTKIVCGVCIYERAADKTCVVDEEK